MVRPASSFSPARGHHDASGGRGPSRSSRSVHQHPATSTPSPPRGRQDDAYVVDEGPVFHERPPSGHDIALQRGATRVVDLSDGRGQRGAVYVLPEKLTRPRKGEGKCLRPN